MMDKWSNESPAPVCACRFRSPAFWVFGKACHSFTAPNDESMHAPCGLGPDRPWSWAQTVRKGGVARHHVVASLAAEFLPPPPICVDFMPLKAVCTAKGDRPTVVWLVHRSLRASRPGCDPLGLRQPIPWAKHLVTSLCL